MSANYEKSTASTSGMTSEQLVIYGEGRGARVNGRGTEYCRHRCPVKKSFWLAGWHDQDMELGVRRF